MAQCTPLRTSGQGLHREPGPCKKHHVLQRPSLCAVLQVVLFQLRQRKKTLHHSLILHIHLTERKNKLSLHTLLIILDEHLMFAVPPLFYHAPLGVLSFAGCIVMDIFVVKLSVVHIGFLNDLEKKRGRAVCSFVRITVFSAARDKKRATYFNDSRYPRVLAVAVVKESQLLFFHLSHKVARLQMIHNSEEEPHREKKKKKLLSSFSP